MSIFTTGLGGNAEYSVGLMPYFLFMGNINTELLDAAFGKNNEDEVKDIGMALAMYAKFKDPTINIEESFSNVIQCNTLSDIKNNSLAINELLLNKSVIGLIDGSNYAFETLGLTSVETISASKGTNSTGSSTKETTFVNPGGAYIKFTAYNYNPSNLYNVTSIKIDGFTIDSSYIKGNRVVYIPLVDYDDGEHVVTVIASNEELGSAVYCNCSAKIVGKLK